MQRITGAGIMIIESYKNTNCYVVFRSPRSKEYNDPGGLIDPGETPPETACRECREETANLLKFSVNDLSYHVKVGGYISYAVYVNGLRKMDYQNNIRITHSGCAHQWAETDQMVRVPIMNVDYNRLPRVKDYDGNDILLRGRTSRIMKEMAKIIVNVLQSKPIQLIRHVTQVSRNKCLLGTTTYTTTQLNTTNIGQNKIEYAIYIAPDIQFTNFPQLRSCNNKWGGLHITIAGFSKIQPNKTIVQIPIKSRRWSPNKKTTIVKQKYIIIKSDTLNKISIYLNNLGVNKLKGPIFGNENWHVTVNCPNVQNIAKILYKSTWSLYIVTKRGSNIVWGNPISI